MTGTSFPATERGALHRPEMTDKKVRVGPVALVDDKDIRDLQQSRLHGLDIVSCLRGQYDQGAVGQAGDLDLILSYAYRLDDDRIEGACFTTSVISMIRG